MVYTTVSLNGDQVANLVELMKTLSTRLRKARDLRRMSQGELGKRIRVSANLISMIENGKCGASIRTMVAAANALNVSLDYLGGLVDEPQPAREMAYELKERYARILDLEAGRRSWSISESVAHIEMIDIRTADSFLTGLRDKNEGTKSKIAFPLRWLHDQHLTPENCRVAIISDESMEPELANGCSILLDLNYEKPRDREIYAVLIGHQLIVRRATRDYQAGWLLSSDNPDKEAFPTRVWPNNAYTAGRVVWHGQSFRSNEQDDAIRRRRMPRKPDRGEGS